MPLTYFMGAPAAQFLEDMDVAGHKQKYERQIQSEISVRVAQLKVDPWSYSVGFARVVGSFSVW